MENDSFLLKKILIGKVWNGGEPRHYCVFPSDTLTKDGGLRIDVSPPVNLIATRKWRCNGSGGAERAMDAERFSGSNCRGFGLSYQRAQAVQIAAMNE
jgi:hypothetical protein